MTRSRNYTSSRVLQVTNMPDDKESCCRNEKTDLKWHLKWMARSERSDQVERQ